MLPGFRAFRDNLLKNKILVENFTFLSVLQVSNLILFIITIPFLFRVLGSQTYGLIVFAQTIVLYLTILINFGFNLTATRDVSVNRNNAKKLSEIFSAVLTIKFAIFLLSLVLMVVLSSSLTELREHQKLYVFSMLAALSEALFPVWFFQGIEKMKYISFINVITRILATVFVFVLINDGSDYFYYPLIIGAGTISGALIGLWIVSLRYRVLFRFLSPKVLLLYLKENFLYFVSNIATQLYINANRLVIGTFLGMVEVAYYDLADKVVNIAKVPLSLLGQTLFPRVARDKNVRFLKRILLYTVIFTVIIVSAIFLFSSQVINLLSGAANDESVQVLRILSLSLLPISLSLFYGDLLLINFGLKVQYARMRFFGFIFYLVFFFILYSLKAVGVQQVAVIIVAVETVMTLYSYILLKRSSVL